MMDNKLPKINAEDSIFISALYHELFTRILPTIRHDLVGEVSASLMRISILDRFLNKVELEPAKLKSELMKVDQQLRSNIISIRGLSFWDNSSTHNDSASNILIRSVQLISTPLATKNIQLNVHPHEHAEAEMIETKPILYCLLCLFAYIEDNNFDHHILNIFHLPNSIKFALEPKKAQDSTPNTHNRNIMVSKEMTVRFAKLHCFEAVFDNQQITLGW